MSFYCIVYELSEAGNHIERNIEMVSVQFYIASVNDIGLCQMSGVILDAFLQRDGGEPSRGLHLDG